MAATPRRTTRLPPARLPPTTFGERVRAHPLPRTWDAIRPRTVWMAVVAIGLVIGAMWWHHGGVRRGDLFAAAGQLSALYGTYAALVGILLMSRAPWLDQVIGPDRLRVVHRWLGFATLWLLVTHGITSTIAFADDSIAGAPAELLRLVQTVPGMLGAVVSLALFIVVAVTSIRAARRRLSYETWHGLHLYTYLAVALGFLHQLTIGTDFVNERLAIAFWVGLYVIAFGPLLLHRLLEPIAGVVRHRWIVSAVEREASGVYSLYIGGRSLDRFAVRAGQYFVIRAMRRDGWWRGHPFSLSAAPNGRELRFTIKELGDGSRAFRDLPVGTHLILEGPYGVLHGGRRSARQLLFVAGGIGITPLRALAESLPYRPGEADLVYRAASERDLVFREELDVLAAHRGLRIHYLVGPRGADAVGDDPFGRAAMRRLIPDVAGREAYVCGPLPLMNAVEATLRSLGVPARRIHLERFN